MGNKSGWQLSRGQRVTYSVGMFSSSIVTATVLAWVLYFYAPPPNAVDKGMIFLGAGLAIGLARLLGALVDAVTNPLVAFWSDRSTHPRGRRAPFILRGAVPLAVLAVLIWFPPVRGFSSWNVVWLAVTLSGTWFFYTYVVAPYLALMPEITTHAEERVSLTVTMSYFEVGATLIASLGVPPLLEALRGGVQIGPIFLADGFKLTAIVLAVLGCVGFFVSVSKIREKKLAEEKRTKFSLKQSIVECFRNPAFPPYLYAVFFAKIAIGLVLISFPFLATAVLNKGEGFAAILFLPMFLGVVLGFPVAQWMANRLGLKSAFRIATGLAALIILGFFGAYFLGGGHTPLTGVHALPGGDVRLVFGGDGRSPAPGPGGAAPPRFVEEGERVSVRLTALEWQGLFRDADLEAFHEAVEAMTEREAAALLRDDTARDREPAGGGAREWLLGQGVEALARHLLPAHESLLYPREKQRYDEGLYLGAPMLAGPPVPGEPARLWVEVGLLEEPEETWNLDGWRLLFSSREEREAMGPVRRPTVSHEERVELFGEVRYADGNLVLSGFGRPPTSGGSAAALAAPGPASSRLLADPHRLDYLLGRFDLGVELAWSARIYVILFLCFLLGLPAAILTSMYRPIVCEVVDLDEQRVGVRREAMYFGVEGLLTKFADGVSGLVAPAVMVLGHWLMPPPFGYVLTFAVGSVLVLVGYVIFGRYPLGQPPPRDGDATASASSRAIRTTSGAVSGPSDMDAS